MKNILEALWLKIITMSTNQFQKIKMNDIKYITVPKLQKKIRKSVATRIKSRLHSMRKSLSRKRQFVVTFVPILYFPPKKFSLICIRICDCEGSRIIEPFYINGNKAELEKKIINGRDILLLCKNNWFVHWENIVAFQKPFRADNVFLFPCIEDDDPSYSLEKEIELPGESWEIYSTEDLQKGKSNNDKPLVQTGYEFVSDTQRSIDLATTYLINSLNVDEQNQFRGLFYTAYDLDQKGFRALSWVWTSAIVIKALLGELKINPGDNKIQSAIQSASKYLIEKQIKTGPNSGGYMVRWDIWPESECGIVPWLAPNDAAFIGCNALLPLYSHFNEAEYLNAALKLANWIVDKGTSDNDLVYVGYRLDKKCWDKEWLYVDAAFTIPFFEKIYELNEQAKWKEWANRFIQQFERKFKLEGGFYRAILRENSKTGKHIFTRGQGWVLDGLISSYRFLSNQKYLESAIELAQLLQKTQINNGGWYYSLHDASSGEDAKAVPVLAFHFLQLFELTHDKWLLNTAFKALKWCQEHQISEKDSIAGGGIASFTREGSIAGRKNATIIFSYSVAYYILSIRKLQSIGKLESYEKNRLHC